MAHLNTIKTVLPAPLGRASEITKFHSTTDIVNEIKRAHEINKHFAGKIAKHFDRGNTRSTASSIFDFVKSNIRYEVEPANRQTTKTIPRILSDGFGDCKHYSGFIASILNELNIPHSYRFVSFGSNTTPTHVYVVAYDESQNPIILDAVLPFFDTEKPYTYKKDLPMALYHLSGIGRVDEIGAFIGKRKNLAQRVTQRVSQTAKKVTNTVANKVIKPVANKVVKPVANKVVKPAAKRIAPVAKKAFQGSKTVSMAPGRNAFLALVALNVRGMATSLRAANQTNLKKRWNQLGGDFTKLTNAINTGARKNRIMGFDPGDQYIGEPISITAALATAAPVITAMAVFLGSSKKVVNEAKDLHKSVTGKNPEEQQYTPDSDPGVNPGTATQQTGENTTQNASGGNTRLLLIGGVAMVAFFALNKKK
jgi:hypothetical protein